ncbi:MAG: hypothetical protein L0Y39_02080 [Methylococcaceae bacterium]|nr:hypothetical protein [Methylococcaceae bacterium]
MQLKREQDEKLNLLQSLQGLQAERTELRKQLDERLNDMFGLTAPRALLGALRQVALDLHFTETTEPSFEKPGERGSRIVFSVDTHDRGRIDFHLQQIRLQTTNYPVPAHGLSTRANKSLSREYLRLGLSRRRSRQPVDFFCSTTWTR